ncbi:inorganic phosphate transporter [Ichthyenterobacterium magnum]|uniref:Phosphate transporter n=1 Tax=Ichthyenterobacterium magnum TaxID=1230530 RepID=A0A420DW09_9FLAO|nr:inorganic phosphate transporter [Ichthyenterobacterium magnum]RKE98409.1 PiT family inorganic phosphate transporter [Ichthyenterobacterium magnum]
MILILLFLSACFLAYSNGANDNFKGVATLFGSGTTNFKKAIGWATATTFSGSVAAIFLANELVKNFSGKGLVPDDLITVPIFAISIALGAAITVFIATKIGMPISTTHSLVGALFGAGVMAVGMQFNFDKLIDKFLFPLIISPLMAAVVSLLVYIIFRFFRKRLGVTKTTNLNIHKKQTPSIPSMNMDNTINLKTSKSIEATLEQTIETYEGQILGLSSQKVLDSLHYLSAGIVSFARGLNDTPKIIGLLVIINAIDIKWSMIIIAIIMALGGLINAKKVGVTMSKKITPMNSGQGFTANLVTGLLVTTASFHGMPVSTTHVSVGSIFGIGTATKKANLKMVSKILLSWLLTLPMAAIVSGLLYKLLETLS